MFLILVCVVVCVCYVSIVSENCRIIIGNAVFVRRDSSHTMQEQ